jgi:hypothetical protein
VIPRRRGNQTRRPRSAGARRRLFEVNDRGVAIWSWTSLGRPVLSRDRRIRVASATVVREVRYLFEHLVQLQPDEGVVVDQLAELLHDRMQRRREPFSSTRSACPASHGASSSCPPGDHPACRRASTDCTGTPVVSAVTPLRTCQCTRTPVGHLIDALLDAVAPWSPLSRCRTGRTLRVWVGCDRGT